MNEPESNSAATPQVPAAPAPSQVVRRGWILGVLGWGIPGLGHFLLKKYDRALVFFVSILAMGVMGLLMGAKLYAPPFGEGQGLFVALLHVLGFIGDLGAGGLLLVAKAMGFGGDYMNRALGDYGTVFFLCAGLLNLLTALDAYDIAVGKKE